MIIIFVVIFVCKSVYYLQGVAEKKYWSEISVPQIHVTVLDQFGSYWTVSYHFVCLFGPYLSYGFVNIKFQKDTFFWDTLYTRILAEGLVPQVCFV